MAAGLNDVLAIFARHINWHGEEGDRITVAEFLGRDAETPGTFDGMQSDKPNADNIGNDQNSDDAETDRGGDDSASSANKSGSADSAKSPGPAKSAGNTSTRR